MDSFVINECFAPLEIGMLNQYERENGHTRIGQKFQSNKPRLAHNAFGNS
jgi:hypothetical protein